MIIKKSTLTGQLFCKLCENTRMGGTAIEVSTISKWTSEKNMLFIGLFCDRCMLLIKAIINDPRHNIDTEAQ